MKIIEVKENKKQYLDLLLLADESEFVRMMGMKCALAAAGFINGDIEYNKAVLADTLGKCAGKADAVIFGEAFLQGFDSLNFTAGHDMAVAVSREGRVIHELCQLAKEHAIAISFGFLEQDCGAFFSSQLTIDQTGRILDLYRRVSPGWKEPSAGKEYREGSGFHTFDFLGKKAAVGLCGDFWYEETIARLNDLKPDIVWWPVYTDYSASEWNRTAKLEYAKQAGKLNVPVLYVNSVCLDQADACGAARGGAALFENGFIKEELPAGQEGILIVEA